MWLKMACILTHTRKVDQSTLRGQVLDLRLVVHQHKVMAQKHKLKVLVEKKTAQECCEVDCGRPAPETD